MVIGKRERKNQPRFEFAIDPLRLHAGTRKTENGDLGVIHDRTETCSPKATQVGDGERSAFHFFRSQFLLARFLGQLRHFGGKFDNVLLVHFAYHRHQQPAFRIHRHTNVHVLLVNNFCLLHVNRGIELREDFQGRGDHFERNGSDGHLAPGFFRFGGEARPQLFEFGDVSSIVLRHMRDGIPRFAEMFCSLAPHAAHRHALDFSPLREVG